MYGDSALQGRALSGYDGAARVFPEGEADVHAGAVSSLSVDLPFRVVFFSGASSLRLGEVLDPGVVRLASKTEKEKEGKALRRLRVQTADPIHSNNAHFSVARLESKDAKSFLDELNRYIKHCGFPHSLFHLESDEEAYRRMRGMFADDRFETEIRILSREIRERVSKLRTHGLTSLAILKLIGEDETQTSRLLIDARHRIFLPDFGNREIRLSPLHKAVFFLFLHHPEGIFFKDLPDYRDELNAIYGEITGRSAKEDIDESVRKLTDPLDNSINEKCARIKNAFVSAFRDEIAQWYYISGKKGERKSIRLPRNLVQWDVPVSD